MKSTRRKFVWVAFVVAGLSIGAEQFALAEQNRNPGRERDIPWPFESVNRKVELADGEFYTLTGTVVIGQSPADPSRDQAFFEIDLAQHPWLASKKRKDYPFYALEGSLSFWLKYEEERVKINCQAISKNGEIRLKLIPLTPAKEPIRLLEDQRSRGDAVSKR